MKSAYELAMARLEKSAPTQKLNADQKARLAEVDSEFQAKIAERRLFLEGEIAKAGDPDAREELRRQLALEIARLEERREEKKDKIRGEAAG